MGNFGGTDKHREKFVAWGKDVGRRGVASKPEFSWEQKKREGRHLTFLQRKGLRLDLSAENGNWNGGGGGSGG